MFNHATRFRLRAPALRLLITGLLVWGAHAQPKHVPKRPLQDVLVCMSSGAYAYHSGYCGGLKACKAPVKQMSIQQAQQMGRKPCGSCY